MRRGHELAGGVDGLGLAEHDAAAAPHDPALADGVLADQRADELDVHVDGREARLSAAYA